MSSIGGNPGPIQGSFAQAAQAQQSAAKSRDSEKAASERGRRLADLLDLRVAGIEDIDAVRATPENDSEEAQAELDGRAVPRRPNRDDDERPRIDLKA